MRNKIINSFRTIWKEFHYRNDTACQVPMKEVARYEV